mgnify:CR=1 FL=1
MILNILVLMIDKINDEAASGLVSYMMENIQRNKSASLKERKKNKKN